MYFKDLRKSCQLEFPAIKSLITINLASLSIRVAISSRTLVGSSPSLGDKHTCHRIVTLFSIHYLGHLVSQSLNKSNIMATWLFNADADCHQVMLRIAGS